MAAVDVSGKAVAGQQVTVDAFQRQSFSYRKRLVGGFYAYEYKNEVTRIAASCSGRTDRHGLLTCDLAPGVSGQVLLRARGSDAAGHAAIAVAMRGWSATTNGGSTPATPTAWT